MGQSRWPASGRPPPRSSRNTVLSVQLSAPRGMAVAHPLIAFAPSAYPQAIDAISYFLLPPGPGDQESPPLVADPVVETLFRFRPFLGG